MLVASERREPFPDYMGSDTGIANPFAARQAKVRRPSSARLSEQRIGGGAMNGGLVSVSGDASDFGFQQRDAVGKFGLRIGRKILGSEATRRVSGRSWAVRFFH